ncbi:hypothetical protein ACTFIU_010212 [Dictyostelium citrinum]
MNNRQEEPTNENTDPNQNNSCLSITSFKLPPYNTLLNNYNIRFKNHHNNNNNLNNNINKNNNNCININKMEIINDILNIDNSDEELNNNNSTNNSNNNNNKNVIYNNFKLNKNNEKRIKRSENSLLNKTIASLEECTISPLTEEQRYSFQQGLKNLPQTPTIFEVVTPPTTPPGIEIARVNRKKEKVDYTSSISTMKRKLDFSGYFKSDIA